MHKWAGKIAVVTGASGGIGAATTKALAGHGVHVAALARNHKKIEEYAKGLQSLPGKIHAIQCDVSQLDSIKEAFKVIESTLGGVNILVNNAGIVRDIELLSTADNSKDIQDIINTNLMGVIFCTQEAYRSLVQHDEYGYIININSTSGQTHHFDAKWRENVYPVSKHGVTVVNEITRSELFDKGNKKIRCTVSFRGFTHEDFRNLKICISCFFRALVQVWYTRISTAKRVSWIAVNLPLNHLILQTQLSIC